MSFFFIGGTRRTHSTKEREQHHQTERETRPWRRGLAVYIVSDCHQGDGRYGSWDRIPPGSGVVDFLKVQRTKWQTCIENDASYVTSLRKFRQMHKWLKLRQLCRYLCRLLLSIKTISKDFQVKPQSLYIANAYMCHCKKLEIMYKFKCLFSMF
jgi:hypothetical protein